MILSLNKWRKIFFLSCPRHSDRGLIVDIVYYFQIWNKKEQSIIISRVISSHMSPMYIKTPCICIYISKENFTGNLWRKRLILKLFSTAILGKLFENCCQLILKILLK